ncbi:MAG: COP23 domain-containing protein [Leptolyngbyaceae bacterium]|nr:COP23 domain-containing protein [Leptolyngbyaceae bacterium]
MPQATSVCSTLSQRLIRLGMAASVMAISAVVGGDRPAAAQSVNFFCGSDGSNPVTYATTARGNVPIVRWRTQYFSGAGYTPQQRCSEVSGRFQTYYNNGTLNYITTGIMNGQPVVCTSSTNGGGCDGLIFTLRPTDNASQVVQQLFDIRAGAAGPINQSADRPYVDVEQLLNERPVEAGTETGVVESTPEATPETTPEAAPSGGSLW